MTLCLLGLGDTARQQAQASLAELKSNSQQLTYCRVLSYGLCCVSLLTRSLADAASSIERLIDLATRSNARIWQIEGRFLEARLMVERGDFANGLTCIRDAFSTSRRAGWRIAHAEFEGAFAEALAGTGQFQEALAVVDKVLASADNEDDFQMWYLSEIHRTKGNILLRRDSNQNAAEAAIFFGRAIEAARSQGSLLFELRAATDLARLHVSHGRRSDAKIVLAPIYDRFTEGLELPDLRAARAILED